jgi:hypothetical protein
MVALDSFCLLGYLFFVYLFVCLFVSTANQHMNLLLSFQAGAMRIPPVHFATKAYMKKFNI